MRQFESNHIRSFLHGSFSFSSELQADIIVIPPRLQISRVGLRQEFHLISCFAEGLIGGLVLLKLGQDVLSCQAVLDMAIGTGQSQLSQQSPQSVLRHFIRF